MKTGKLLQFTQRLLLVAVFAGLFSAASFTAKAQVTHSDSLALVQFYNSTNGPSWSSSTNWLTGPVSTWQGVTVASRRVTGLFLPFNNLTGTLPSQIAVLSRLTSLELQGNAITGSIPSVFVLLTNLQILNLSGNDLTGNIPVVLGFNLNLQILNLASNQLSGPIPPTFLLLQKLTFLDLSNNTLTGQVPGGLGLLSKLEFLYLNNNQLSGNIPFTIGFLDSSIEIFMSRNLLTGQIPSSVGDLENLVRFDVSANDLTGNVPATVASMPLLFQLNVSGNELSGLPNLTGMASLLQLRVSDNRLTFEDLEPNKPKMPSSAAYIPQDSVGTSSSVTLCTGDTLVLTADFTGSLPNNRYRWFKSPNTAVTAAVADPVLKIANVQPSNSGIYFARCTNTVVNGLTIVRRPVTVTVNACAAAFASVAVDEVHVYPNTFTTDAVVRVTTEQEEDLQLAIVSKEGSVLETLSGSTNQDISIGQDLKPGFYYLRAVYGDNNKLRRIIKK